MYQHRWPLSQGVDQKMPWLYSTSHLHTMQKGLGGEVSTELKK